MVPVPLHDFGFNVFIKQILQTKKSVVLFTKICQKLTDRWRCILYLGWSWNCAILRNFLYRNFAKFCCTKFTNFHEISYRFTKLIIWINFVKFWLNHFTKFCEIKMLFRPILYFAKSRKPKEHDRGMRKMIITRAKAVRWLASMLSPFSSSLFVLKLLYDMGSACLNTGNYILPV